METKDRKTTTKSRNPAGKESVKDKVNGWIHKSPKLEAFVENSTYFIKHPDKFTEKVNEIYNRATESEGQKQIGEFAGKLKSAYRMTKMALSGEYEGIPKGKVILGMVGLFYLISPVDIFPDFLPFLGFVDDAGLLLWLVKYAAEEVDKFEQWEQSQGLTTANPAY